LWVYYSTQILLMGAEITKARSDWRKKHETPAPAQGPRPAPEVLFSVQPPLMPPAVRPPTISR
jgi:hypothetical protein